MIHLAPIPSFYILAENLAVRMKILLWNSYFHVKENEVFFTFPIVTISLAESHRASVTEIYTFSIHFIIRTMSVYIFYIYIIFGTFSSLHLASVPYYIMDTEGCNIIIINFVSLSVGRIKGLYGRW